MKVETGEAKEHPTYKRIQEYVLKSTASKSIRHILPR